MENNKTCPISISDGTDLNTIFMQWQESQRHLVKTPADNSGKESETVEIKSCRPMLPYSKPIYAEVKKKRVDVEDIGVYSTDRFSRNVRPT